METTTLQPDQYQLAPVDVLPHWLTELLSQDYKCTCDEKNMSTHEAVCSYCSEKLWK